MRDSLTSGASTGADRHGADGHAADLHGANGHGPGHGADLHGPDGHGADLHGGANGHAADGHAADGHGPDGHGADRHSRGSARFRDTLGTAGTEVLESLADVAPDMAGFIVDFAYGDVHARPGLSARQRSLVTIGVLSGIGGCEPQLTAHVHGALNVGLRPAEIVEAMMHCTVYAGFPRALNALTVLRAVFEERGLLPGLATPTADGPAVQDGPGAQVAGRG